MTMPSEASRQRAAQAWCTPLTSHIEMDSVLAEAFASIIEDIWSRAWLGNATTSELLTELQARAEVAGYASYKTVGGEGS